MSDIDDLLAPVSHDDPAGPNLDDAAERQQIVIAFDAVAADADADVDWRAIVGLIEAESAKTKDLWLAVYLARAGARLGRLDLVQRGCDYLAGLVELYWETVHPTLDDLGFQGRRGPCESLTHIGPFLGPLQRMPVISHPRLGSFSAEDMRRFSVDGETADGYGLFRAALADIESDELAAIVGSIRQTTSAIRRVDAALVANAGSDTGVNFAPTYDVLDTMLSTLARFADIGGNNLGDDEGQEETDASSACNDGAGRVPAPARAGSIESREDVERAIDAVIDYYRRREPGSPVPVALSRARRWVTMDFLAVLEDIVPDSVRDAQRVLTWQKDE